MSIIAYYRVSTADQTIENQRLEITSTYKVDKEFTDEAVSGTTKGNEREGFAAMAAYIREGDTLVVVDLDRLGRDSIDVQTNIANLKERGVNIIVTRMGIDLSTDAGELLVTIMSKVAEMERRKTMERSRAGIARAQAEGKHCGRPKITNSVSPMIVKELRETLSIKETAEHLGISVSSVKRLQAK